MKKYEIVYQKYRYDILNGFLKQNEFLPSIRESVELFKTSKTSVEHAYELLMSEGYIESQEKIGYFVSIDQERIQLHKNFDEYLQKKETKNIQYDLRSNTILPTTFDLNIWKKYMREAYNQSSFLSTYGETQGEYDLRIALSQYAYQQRNVLSTYENIIVSSNLQSLLFLLCGLFPKDITIGMEESGFAQAEQVFSSYGIHCIKIKSCNDGIDINDLKQYHIDILFMISSDCGKQKKAISPSLRNTLLEYTSQNNILIIEDDHNGELNYMTSPSFAMQGYAKNDHVIYCGSFSRLLPPSIRISYMVLNQKYLKLYQANQNHYSPMSSKLEQQALAKYICDGHLKKQLRKLKKEYHTKCIYMHSLLSQYFSSFYLEEAALRFHIPLSITDSFDYILEKCYEKNIAIEIYNNENICVSFAGISIEDMDKAISMLYHIIKEYI